MITLGWYNFARGLLLVLGTLLAVSYYHPWPIRLQIILVLAFCVWVGYFVSLARHAIAKPPEKKEDKN